MKTNFTLSGKSLLVIIFTLAFTKSFSYNNISPASNNLQVIIENNNLIMNWTIPATASINYAEVQASKDGKTFTTIGYVMGADPKQDNNSFIFKQNLKKLKPGKIFYRVLNITADDKVIASEVVKLP